MSCKQYQSIEVIEAVPEIQLVSMLFQVVNLLTTNYQSISKSERLNMWLTWLALHWWRVIRWDR